jgi:pilus assembly protein CpaB
MGLLLAGALAAVTGIIVFATLQSGDSSSVKSATGGPETVVITAKGDIPARTEIKADMLEITKVPANALLAGAFTSQSQVVGRVARIPIYTGEQLVQDKLASSKTDLGLSYIVPDGMRAMGVKVDKVIGAGGLIRPGDRVDVVAVVEVKYQDLNTEREITDTRSLTVGQNIEVLAVEQKLENQIAPATGGSTQTSTTNDGTPVDQPAAQPDSKVVTLALTPEQTQAVMLSEAKGSIRLVVRAPGDTTITDLPDSTFLSLSDPAFQKSITDALKVPKK